MRPQVDIRVLSAADMQSVHETVLAILADPGMEFTSLEGLETLRERERVLLGTETGLLPWKT